MFTDHSLISCPFGHQNFRLDLIGCFTDEVLKHHIPFRTTLEVVRFLSNENEISDWHQAGLPKDDLSIQNATIIKHCMRQPLLIDPQEQVSG
jgi:dynein heavy chain